AQRRAPVWGGQWTGGRVARQPALPGSGPLTAVALWAALNALSSPGSAAYFHNYQYDPGYLQWRQEADREAANNPAVAAKLQQLDTQLAQMADQPRNPAAASPAQSSPAPSGGTGTIWVVLFIGIAILALLWLWRRRHAHPGTAAAAPGLAGSATTCREARRSFSSTSAPMASRTNAGTSRGSTRSLRRTAESGEHGSIRPKA